MHFRSITYLRASMRHTLSHAHHVLVCAACFVEVTADHIAKEICLPRVSVLQPTCLAKTLRWGACALLAAWRTAPEISRNDPTRWASTQGAGLTSIIVVLTRSWLYVGMKKSVCLRSLSHWRLSVAVAICVLVFSPPVDGWWWASGSKCYIHDILLSVLRPPMGMNGDDIS